MNTLLANRIINEVEVKVLLLLLVLLLEEAFDAQIRVTCPLLVTIPKIHEVICLH